MPPLAALAAFPRRRALRYTSTRLPLAAARDLPAPARALLASAANPQIHGSVEASPGGGRAGNTHDRDNSIAHRLAARSRSLRRAACGDCYRRINDATTARGAPPRPRQRPAGDRDAAESAVPPLGVGQ